MRAIVSILCAASLTACAPTPRILYPGRLPPYTYLDLASTFAVASTGELDMTLWAPCIVYVSNDSSVARDGMPCRHQELNAIHLVAVTPWGAAVPGVWSDTSHLLFRVNWDLDVPYVQEDLLALLSGPWKITGLTWQPSTDSARRFLGLVHDAASIVVPGDLHPHLEVTRFEVGGGALQAGGQSTLSVELVNHGQGPAYRVTATVQSGVLSHGRRLEFGTIKPNTARLRGIRLTLPATETAPDAMLVVAFDEGNGFSPVSVSRRVPIVPPVTAPVLAAQCWVPGRNRERPELDAGEDVVVRCVVHNTGTGAASVVLEATIDGVASKRVSPATRIAPADRATLDLVLGIPRGLALDSAVQLTITARDNAFARSAKAAIVGVIRQPKLCAVGQLTHAQYHAKLAELRAAMAAGDLTQAQLDRYDAELVACLNDEP
jgi:hypothetical protein